MSITAALAEQVGVQDACEVLLVPRASFYRHRARRAIDESSSAPASPAGEASPAVTAVSPPPRPRPPLALSEEERQTMLELMHSPRFVDDAPRQIWAKLLDEDGRYVCSVRTMYRLLEAEDEVRERRNQLRRPAYQRPELLATLATGPNQVWSWDISKLKGPQKWSYFYLYVILDIYSRYVVGWMLAHRECTKLAKRLITETIEKQDVVPGQLTLHADRGPSMLAVLLAELGVTKTHNRPYTSNDNPYSEAHFKTLKYQPLFPERFGSYEDARAYCTRFFPWYNTEHRHSSLALLTPEDVHHGRAEQVLERRERVLRKAFEANPRRFKGRVPTPGELPEAAWINPPRKRDGDDDGSKPDSRSELH